MNCACNSKVRRTSFARSGCRFVTASVGTDPGQPNGYMFPLPGGAFLVKRFGNAIENSTWFDGPNGQYAFLNVHVPFDKAVHHFAINNTTKGFAFERPGLEAMLKAIGVSVEIPVEFTPRLKCNADAK